MPVEFRNFISNQLNSYSGKFGCWTEASIFPRQCVTDALALNFYLSFVMNKILPLICMVLIAGCTARKTDKPMTPQPAADSVTSNPPDSGAVAAETKVQTPQVYTLTNAHGVKIKVTEFGGKVISLLVPDRTGKLGDVVLGYDDPNSYLKGNPYFGALIGRYGNRIGKGLFELDGVTYLLTKNNNGNSLHGGPGGFHNVFWKVVPGKSKDGQKLDLYYESHNGEEGYPGNLMVKVTYTLTEKDELVIDYEASTDKTTVINLSHHSFFNLTGDPTKDILGHTIMINADQFTPVDAGLIPTGELKSVKGTPFDFSKPVAIGERIDQNDEQLKFGKGYDHNFVLRRKDNNLMLAAAVREPVSGRVMDVWTTEPGLQFYSGNFLDGKDVGKGGIPYQFRSAFCLEAQHYPDSPNHKNFPSTILKPGEMYRQKTIYKFSVDK